MLDDYKKTVKRGADQRETDTAYERLALRLLDFGKQEGTIKSKTEVLRNESKRST